MLAFIVLVRDILIAVLLSWVGIETHQDRNQERDTPPERSEPAEGRAHGAILR